MLTAAVELKHNFCFQASSLFSSWFPLSPDTLPALKLEDSAPAKVKMIPKEKEKAFNADYSPGHVNNAGGGTSIRNGYPCKRRGLDAENPLRLIQSPAYFMKSDTEHDLEKWLVSILTLFAHDTKHQKF